MTELVLTKLDERMRSLLDRRAARAGVRTVDGAAELAPVPLDGHFDSIMVSTMVPCTVHDPACWACRDPARVGTPRAGSCSSSTSALPLRGAVCLGRIGCTRRGASSRRAAAATSRRSACSPRRACVFELVERARWRGMPFVVAPLVYGKAAP